VRLDLGAHGIRGEDGDGSAVEDLALDGPPLHDHTDVAVERVDAGLQECVDRRRHGDLAVPALADVRQHLLDEQRIALGALDDLPAEPLREIGPDEESREKRVREFESERLENDRRRVRPRHPPRRPGVEEIGTSEAEDENGRRGEADDVLDEVEQRLLGPVDVVRDDDERSVPCKSLE
jgi:hypothetical protein